MALQPLRPTPADNRPVYAVAGGNHVTMLLDRSESGGTLDVIEVLAQPGGGPPPHRHEFGEFFEVLEGELTLSEERAGVIVCTRVLGVGDTVWIAPGTFHGTLNLSDAITRFTVVGQPGLMSGYFAEAGVPVPDPLTQPERRPAGPDRLGAIAARWGIEFWRGPVDVTPPPL
ncbi:cupin domain-containing protein [Conexibacter sp. CPCC 206217]|uniref:cupin domain-containing protein n=1 Tax=Conexibacter sp. CPCC 206217 TaxID=3064574 RepID=UPI002724C47B|nr:cupin domain-containing protein [Conexibacter sp. CPCC 206217]MDO8214152.1 cupin domain-containing protein [Conexibacter sp. CPCC 206217]